jgi:hypothetical protein
VLNRRPHRLALRLPPPSKPRRSRESPRQSLRLQP